MNNNFKKFSAFLFHGCLNCLAGGLAAPAGVPSLLLSLAGSITGNLASEHLSSLISYDKILDKLKGNDPNQVNHDLERLFKEATVISISYIRKLFLAELKTDVSLEFERTEKERKRIVSAVDSFLKQNEGDAKMYITNEAIDKTEIGEPRQFLQDLVTYLIGAAGVEIEETIRLRLVEFYATHLPYCFDLAFKEALKNDEKGFKAFQIWMLEIQEQQNIQLLQSIGKVEVVIENIRKGIDTLVSQYMENSCENCSREIYHYLDNEFVSISTALEGLAAEIKSHFRALYSISEEQLRIAKETYQKVSLNLDISQELKIMLQELLTREQKTLSSFDHHLVMPLPFKPQVFMGRKAELKSIQEKMLKDNFVFLNGEGGMGKTSLAAVYYYTHCDNYHHVAWVLSEKSITDALLLMAIPLKLRFEKTMPTEERLQQLMAAMLRLPKPCLLIIDNVDEAQDLENHILRLRSFPNFHLLVTSRLKNAGDEEGLRLAGIEAEEAIALFKKYYARHTSDEDGLFLQMRKAVGANTLVITLFAKNLAVLNENEVVYRLTDLLADLQKRGFLALSESEKVITDYKAHGPGLRIATVEDIVSAMYDLGDLNDAEVKALSALAVLPPENIAYPVLKELCKPEDTRLFGKTLNALYRRGWVDRIATEDSTHYIISPVVQEITKKNNDRLLEDCYPLIDVLADRLGFLPGAGYFPSYTYSEAAMYARYAESLLACFDIVNSALAILYERLGNYYTAIGNLGSALFNYRQFNKLEAELHQSYADNVEYKNNLAISYQNLGNIASALGKSEQALSHYQNYNKLEAELHQSFPDNVEYKNGLAVSYQNLGNIASALGKSEEALSHYQNYNKLKAELHQSFPDNVGYKNGLAISYSKLGEIASALGKSEEALSHYQNYNKLEAELHQSFPDNVEYKNGLAVSYQNLGEIASALGKSEEALSHYQNYNKLEAELHQSFPDNVEYKNGLAVSYSNLGNIASALGKSEEALSHYKKDIELSETLHQSYPDNVEYKNGLAVSYQNLGNIASALGKSEEALSHYQNYNKLEAELHQSFPDNVGYKNNLAISFAKLGVFYKYDKINKVEALNRFKKAEKLWMELTLTSPNVPEYQKYLMAVRKQMSDL